MSKIVHPRVGVDAELLAEGLPPTQEVPLIRGGPKTRCDDQILVLPRTSCHTLLALSGAVAPETLSHDGRQDDRPARPDGFGFREDEHALLSSYLTPHRQCAGIEIYIRPAECQSLADAESAAEHQDKRDMPRVVGLMLEQRVDVRDWHCEAPSCADGAETLLATIALAFPDFQT